MPWIEYRCRKCGHEFKRLSGTGEADERARCPRCGAAEAAVLPSTEPLFGGIAAFSSLSKDTN